MKQAERARIWTYFTEECRILAALAEGIAFAFCLPLGFFRFFTQGS